MAEKSVYDVIKKQNGEKFAKAIRNYDNGIFDIPDIAAIVKYAGRDAEPIMNYLVSLKDIRIQESNSPDDPFELLYSAGYDAVYADTLERQNAIVPYFADDERLCTFNDPQRYKYYYIVNVVHHDAKKLKREDFKNPQREDAYGTSVMSIQMLKTGGFISIKNRYNHTVQHPDNTYDSNPDNIVPGLSGALRKYFNVDFSSKRVPLPHGYVQMGTHIVKYHAERNNVYYGTDFVAWNGKVAPIDKRSQFILDDFIFDVSNGGAKNKNDFPDGAFDDAGAFMTSWRMATAGQKMHVGKTQDGATRIATDGGCWVDVHDGQIVGLAMPGLTHVPDGFMVNNRLCRTIYMPDVTSIRSNFLAKNQDLTEIDLPQVMFINGDFLCGNMALSKLNMPKVESIGSGFLLCNMGLTEISLPHVKKIGPLFLRDNEALAKLNMPVVESIGARFLYYNQNLTAIDLPRVKEIYDEFLFDNRALSKLNMPNVESIGSRFLRTNHNLTAIDLPRVKQIGYEFLFGNRVLSELNMPNVESIGDGFLDINVGLTEINLPRVKEIGNDFLCGNTALSKLNMPNVKSIGYGFLRNNIGLLEINLPRVEEISGSFLADNEALSKLNMPNVKHIGQYFLLHNQNLTAIDLPHVKWVGAEFLHNNIKLSKLNMPNVERIGVGFLRCNRNLTTIDLPQVKQIRPGFLLANKNIMPGVAPEKRWAVLVQAAAMARGRDALGQKTAEQKQGTNTWPSGICFETLAGRK